MLVQEIMTRNVVTMDCNETVLDAYKKYRDYKVGCIVITDDERCAGIVTERDLIERTIDITTPEKIKVREIMSSDIKTVHGLEKIEKALEVMEEYKIKKLPVVSDDYVVGIVTISDIAFARPGLAERFIESWIKPRWED